MKTIILKLGGGVLTRKRQSRPVARTNLIKRIAKELSYVYKKKPQFRIILLCGAGSFGHNPVYKYRLLGRPLTDSTMFGVSRVINSVRELGSFVAKICLNAGLPVTPFQTASMAFQRNGKIYLKNLSTIEIMLKNHRIPLLGGDIIIGKKNQILVVSADELAVLLAKHFKNSKVLFATDVEGVYRHFPPKKGERPLKFVDRRMLKELVNKRFTDNTAKKYDVTGAMTGKLKKLLQLRKKKVIIFNGQKSSLIRKVLMGERNIGTSILL